MFCGMMDGLGFLPIDSINAGMNYLTLSYSLILSLYITPLFVSQSFICPSLSYYLIHSLILTFLSLSHFLSHYIFFT